MSALAPRDLPPDRNPALVYLMGLSEGTRASRAHVLRRVARVLAPGVEPVDVPWERLRYAHVAALRARLLDDGLAPGTVNKVLSALRALVREAWRLGLCTADDLLRVREVKNVPDRRLPRGRMLSWEETGSLLAAAGPRERAAVALMMGAGLRVGEACALPLGAVDYDAGAVYVHGKGGREDRIPLGSNWLGIVRSWDDERWAYHGPLLVRQGGGALTPGSMARALRKAGEKAGIAPFTPHDLRRTYCSRILETGTDLGLAKRMSRHADVGTLLQYDRRDEQPMVELAQLVDL